MTEGQSVQHQLDEVKEQLTSILSRLDDLVRLEVKHDNTIEGLVRAHDRIDNVSKKVDEMEKLVASNSAIARVVERLGWIVITSLIGLLAYLFK